VFLGDICYNINIMAKQGIVSAAIEALRSKETVFFKEDTDLRDRLLALRKLASEYPNNKDVAKECAMVAKGLAGEDEVAYQLKKASVGMYVLRDVKFECDGLTAQIDFIVITPAYIYYVECKNYAGNISVNNRGDFIYEIMANGKKTKRGLYSPLRQAEAQREVIRKIWEKNTSALDKLFTANGFNRNRKVLVVFANRNSFINTRLAPKEIADRVLRSDTLVKKLQDDLDRAGSAIYNRTKKEMEKTAESYLKCAKTDTIDFYDYYRQKFSCRDLRQELVDFRKKRADEKKMPPYYIFNDKELGELSERNPKTIDELAQILPAIKVKTHGAEILKIINR